MDWYISIPLLAFECLLQRTCSWRIPCTVATHLGPRMAFLKCIFVRDIFILWFEFHWILFLWVQRRLVNIVWANGLALNIRKTLYEPMMMVIIIIIIIVVVVIIITIIIIFIMIIIVIIIVVISSIIISIIIIIIIILMISWKFCMLFHAFRPEYIVRELTASITW